MNTPHGVRVPNLVLVGFMGTGKTTVGRLLADRLGLPFVDMDARIVEREQRSISDIFAAEGEAYFRRVERDLVRELAAGPGCVIGTGGGVVLNPENLAAFAAGGLVVCLTARPETILERVRHDTSRPLLAGDDKGARILSLLEQRRPLYAAIPCRLDTSDLDAGAVADWILARYRAEHPAPRDPAGKILDRAAMAAERERLRAAGRVCVFTNGCFDLVHAGHVSYLAYARAQGDVLCVGLNSDRSVRELKGPSRPLIAEQERALLLASLECVDYVVLFDELHVEQLIRELVPDVLVKGGDRRDWVCGREIVEGAGGRVVLAPELEGRSTTNLLARLQQQAPSAPPR